MEPELPFGDPELLGRLGRRLRRDGAPGTRASLVHLHLAEAAFRSLETVGHPKPTAASLKMAGAVVRAMEALDRHMPDHRVQRASDPAAGLVAIEVMTRSVFENMDTGVGAPIVQAVMGGALRYLRTVCLQCPAECLRHDLASPLTAPLTSPHPLGHSAPVARPAAPAPGSAGRNDPCPCGSGRKFKRCHGR